MSSSQEYTSTTNGILTTVLISPKHVLIAGIYFYYEWYTYNSTNISQTCPHRRNILLLRMVYL